MAEKAGMLKRPPPVPLVIKDEHGRRSFVISINRYSHFLPAAGGPPLSRRESEDLLERILQETTSDQHVSRPTPPPLPLSFLPNTLLACPFLNPNGDRACVR